MLAQQHRMRTSAQFSETTRSGVRSGRRNVVVYAVRTDRDAPSICGFIVSKAVGGAVVRNRVKRRLRELAAEVIGSNPVGWSLVVRALPPSAQADWAGLRKEFRSAWASVERKSQSR